MDETTNYIPGICNINAVEIAKRQRIGYIGLAISILLVAVFIAFGVNWWIRLIIFVPAFISVIGFLQAKNKFCVGFATADMHRADEGEAVKITDTASLQLDKVKTRKMNQQAFIVAVIVTLLTLLLPTL